MVRPRSGWFDQSNHRWFAQADRKWPRLLGMPSPQQTSSLGTWLGRIEEDGVRPRAMTRSGSRTSSAPKCERPSRSGTARRSAAASHRSCAGLAYRSSMSPVFRAIRASFLRSRSYRFRQIEPESSGPPGPRQLPSRSFQPLEADMEATTRLAQAGGHARFSTWAWRVAVPVHRAALAEWRPSGASRTPGTSSCPPCPSRAVRAGCAGRGPC